MKSKKAAPPRRRVSFAVDRDEIDISSDWVQAVMSAPVAPPPRAVVHAPVEKPAALPETTPSGLATSPINNATDAENATGAECAPVARCTSVENTAPVDLGATVEEISPVENIATVEVSREAIENKGQVSPGPKPADNATVENNTPVASFSTEKAPEALSTEPHSPIPPAGRKSRPRPIHRITDGLTPGQYAVYNLMFEAGQPQQDGARIYRGGYADLCRLTGLSKRGIQNIIGELQEKDAIRIEQAPGYHRTETSVYRVPSAAAVLSGWFSRGLRFSVGKSKALVSTAASI